MKNSIFNAVCKTRYLALLVVLIFTCGNVWGADVTGTINFGNNGTKINTTTVTGDDSQENTWTITTVMSQTSFTQSTNYSQVGSGNKPATSITFTTTLPSKQTITAFSAKFGGFSGTAGTVTLKVGETSVGTGSLNASNDVTVSASNTTTSGTVLTVTVTGISKGVKCYYISYTYSNTPACSNNVTINKGTPVTGSSFSLDKTGSQATCNGLTVTVSGITPPSHYHFSAISQSGVAANKVTIDNSAKTVTYAANTTGTSTINVAYEEDPQYTVKWYVNGSVAHSQTGYEGATLTSIPTPTSSDCGGSKVFVGWTTTANYSHASVAPAYISPTTIPNGGANYYAVFATASGGGAATWTETAIGDLTGSDIFVIVGNDGSNYAMTNNNGTSSAPTASSVTISAGKITSSVNDNIKWNISGNSTDGYVFYPNGSTATWLYCTNANNGLRVGTGENKTFSITSDYLYNKGQSRYAGIYNSSDWRSYTSINANIEDQTFAFYKYAAGTTYSNYETTCCTVLGTIDGSIILTTDGCGAGEMKATWKMLATTGIASQTLRVYDENLDEVTAKRITGITASTSNQTKTISGLDPCKEYYVTVENVSSGGEYCTPGDPWESEVVTTLGYTYTITKENVSLKAGETEAARSCDDFMAEYVANTGYNLPTTISVTGASSYTWEDGVLMIDKADVTGNVTVTITGTAQSTSYQLWTAWANGNNCEGDICNTWGWTGGAYFTQVGTSHEWQITNYTIPAFEWDATNQRQMIYNVAGKNPTNTKFYDLPIAVSQGTSSVKKAPMPGAVGTLRMYDNSDQPNGYLGFIPNNYMVRFGTHDYIMTESSNTVWETAIQTLDAADLTASSKYRVGVTNSSNEFVAINENCPETSVTGNSGMGQKSGETTWGSNLAAGDAGKRGKFRIWVDNATANWTCHFVPYHRVVFHSNYQGGGGPADTYAGETSVEESNASIALNPAPTAPTGYTFDGWYDAASGGNKITTPRSISAGASADIELYAHWTANTINLILDKNNSDVSGSSNGSGTIVFDGNATATITGATRTGHTVEGYYSDAACTAANKVLDANGNVINSTVSGYTTSGKWTCAATPTTLFTKWTAETFTVTWYAGGSADGNIVSTENVDYGQKVASCPADPDGSPCDKVFVGWTNTTSYTHGESLLFTDAAGSPTIDADASFYAVFATGGDMEDEITVAETGATAESGTYSSWSDVSISSDAVYAGNTAGGSSGNASVQMRSNNSNSGIVTTASGGKVTKVVVDWNSSSANSRTLDIYGKNTEYTAATDLYDNSTQGTKLGSIVKGTSTELEISGDYSYIGLRSNSGAMYLNSITISWSSATGHTINCADCGTSVTPTYTAAPTGGTVSVTKSATPVASGSTVKTCTAVDLTVTLTPASHYTLTGFTATGLTTGTATISPVVNTVVPTTSAQTFTVTVSAGATGTLTLTPTFTPETPLTITLNTNGKGTYDDPTEWPIYAGESFTLPTVTPSDPTCATFVGWIQGTTFPGDDTTHDAPSTISAGSSSGALSVNTTYTAVFYETETTETDAYVKVTETPASWANDHYLIVYESSETAGVAFDGSLSTLDATNNGIAVTISSGAIAATNTLAASEWKIAAITGGYSIQSASGSYIGKDAYSNGLDVSNSALTNTISVSAITGSGGCGLKYNSASDQLRFRYYKSGQQTIQLYKLGTAVVETRTYTTNPACTPKYRVTVASVTGGSPNANPKFNPENTNVDIIAHPAAGYSFTGWTITKTTGGDNVTSTLLPGDKATTESTSFSMPAYDVTVTASYAKIPVTSLQVKDGETVIANSETVNISTGANKTLTVVVTPADAFDHSWSASVTGGDTYASITNVQAGTFQVNGLAQGDATVTVTAPNDGDAKTVTFTVHVTDILPTEVVLKRDGSNTSISELSIYEGQYVKVNVSFTPTPTDKDFSVSADGTFVTIHAQAHTNPNYYATLNGKKVTTSPVNVTFTSEATSSVTKNLVVTVLPLLTDTFVDYIHGQATQTVSARLSADKFTLYTDINTPSLSDASDADPTSADCETSHYHLIGWLPKATAESMWAAGTAITESTEGLVKAGVQVEATGQTWYAIWGKEQ